MRQVPTYAIIGNGRLARHLCHYFTLLNIPYLHWYRQATTSLHNIIDSASHILLVINDSQIDDFIKQYLALQNKQIIHFSGSHLSEYAYTAHPLMTFSHDLYTLETYRSLSFITEQEGPAFTELLPGLPNHHFAIPREKKAYYHALCVIANNFTTLLWQKFFTALETQLGIATEAGIPLLDQTANNLRQNFQTALTGPLIRNDQTTIARNLAALEQDEFQAIYHAFVTMYQQTQHKQNVV